MQTSRKRLRKPIKIALVVIATLIILLTALLILKINKAKSLVVDEGPEYGAVLDVDISSDDLLADGTLTFMLIDVGQGESIFIDYDDMEILIDGGSYNNGSMTVVNSIKDYVDGPIDVVIATHWHEDHVGGLSTVYENFDVAKTYYGDESEEAWFEIFMKAAKAAGDVEGDKNTAIKIAEGITLTMFDLADNAEDPNNDSTVCVLEYGKVRFFMSGDLTSEYESKLISYAEDCDVVVAGHHGSDTSNSILETLNPEYILVPCGANNEFGHPTETFLRNALDETRNVYATYKSGTIIITTDGSHIESNLDKDDRLEIKNAGGK